MSIPFRHISDEDFCVLFSEDPEKAIAYIHRALKAGEEQAGRAATQALVYLQLDFISAVVSKNVKKYLCDEVADGAALRAVEAVIKTPPELANMTQFRGWLRVIVARHVASVARDKREQRRRDSQSLSYTSEEYEGKVIEQGEHDINLELVGDWDVINQQYELLGEEHQKIIDLRIFADQSSREVARILKSAFGLTVTENNIDQIARRFRDDCQDAAREQ